MSQYLHFGIILITIPNLIVIGLMILVFAVAVVVSLPHERTSVDSQMTDAQPTQTSAAPQRAETISSDTNS